MARSLVVVAKHPEIGKVKTRLALHVGEHLAFRLYSAFVEDISTRFAGVHGAKFIFAHTPADSTYHWHGRPRIAQEGATLNERLLNIFRRHETAFPDGTLIMSSDSPHVAPQWVERGFELLAESDVVLGPAADGGYWCVAMRSPHDIFTGITMSTPTVLRETVALAERRQLRVAFLPTTFDVDELADLYELRDELARIGDRSLPHTAAALHAALESLKPQTA